MEWKDITSYSRSTVERKPTSWEAAVGGRGGLRIVISCGHINHAPDWIMHCFELGINTRPLHATSKDEAISEALEVVRDRIRRLLDYLSIIEA